MDSARRNQLLTKFDRIIPALIDSEDVREKARSAKDLALFRQLFLQFLDEPYKVDWSQIRPMPAVQQLCHEGLPPVQNEQEREAILRRLVVVKLNGGLGTTMGCQGPKALVELRDGLNFLDFALRQHTILNESHGGSTIPLLLMNSFNTDKLTKQYLEEQKGRQQPNGIDMVHCFCQSRCPRIFADSLMPVPSAAWDQCADEGWYPPGHGNVFWALAQSGLLDQLLADGRDLAFFANIDNTGAVFDDTIAKVMADGKADYVMEMTPRTSADVKGGTLVEVDGGRRLMHLECPQVPDERMDEFCSIEKFNMFNTNNIWVNLASVRERLPNMKLEILANKKIVAGAPVLQLEQSIGGAIRNFPDRALAIRVPRTRFMPVKSTRDLFRMRSPCLFQFDASECSLRQQRPTLPEVQLSTEFAALADFEARIPEIPFLHEEVQKIIIKGDVWLGRGLQMRGRIVELYTDGPGQCIRVPDNSIIGNGGEPDEKKK